MAPASRTSHANPRAWRSAWQARFLAPPNAPSRTAEDAAGRRPLDATAMVPTLERAVELAGQVATPATAPAPDSAADPFRSDPAMPHAAGALRPAQAAASVASNEAAKAAAVEAELDEAFLRPLPAVFTVGGLLTVAGAWWVLGVVPGDFGVGLAAWYVCFGCLVILCGLLLRQRHFGAGVAYPGVAAMLMLYAVGDLVSVRSTHQLQYNSELWILMGAGFLLMRTKWLHAVVATTAGLWLGLFWGQWHTAADQQYASMVAAGVALAYCGHYLRRDGLLRAARARLQTEEALVASRESSARLHALTEGSPLGIFHTTLQGRVDYANTRWCEIAGCDYRDFEAIRTAVHPDDRERLTQEWRHCMAQGTELVSEFRYVHPDGQVRDVATRAMPVHDAHGELAGFVGTLEDITQRKKALQADRVAFERLLEIEQLKELDRFKTRILNTASHELNTPITPIKLQLHMLKSENLGPLNTRQAKAVGILDRNLERLSSLVADVLDVARLQDGHLRLDRVEVDVGRAVREGVESFEEPAHAAGVRLTAEAAPGLQVLADPLRFSQVLYNLLSNALKFTPPGGHIQVTARRHVDIVEVRVQDTGHGLSSEQMARLWKPFSQVHDPQKVTAPGTGLGLYISRGIVEAHGGQVGVQSDGPGHGTAFWFTLPLRPGAAGAPVEPVGLPTAAVAPNPRAHALAA